MSHPPTRGSQLLGSRVVMDVNVPPYIGPSSIIAGAGAGAAVGAGAGAVVGAGAGAVVGAGAGAVVGAGAGAGSSSSEHAIATIPATRANNTTMNRMSKNRFVIGFPPVSLCSYLRPDRFSLPLCASSSSAKPCRNPQPLNDAHVEPILNPPFSRNEAPLHRLMRFVNRRPEFQLLKGPALQTCAGSL